MITMMLLKYIVMSVLHPITLRKIMNNCPVYCKIIRKWGQSDNERQIACYSLADTLIDWISLLNVRKICQSIVDATRFAYLYLLTFTEQRNATTLIERCYATPNVTCWNNAKQLRRTNDVIYVTWGRYCVGRRLRGVTGVTFKDVVLKRKWRNLCNI